jgi:glycoprotein-N-acetylgalactosamine 3-beta-galactosyltransferase
LNVTAGDSRDSHKRETFFFANVELTIFPSAPGTDWTSKFPFYGRPQPGLSCCSNNAIAFHYIQPHEMYAYEYLIYHLQPFGVIDLPQPLPDKVNFEVVAEVNRVIATTTMSAI